MKTAIEMAQEAGLIQVSEFGVIGPFPEVLERLVELARADEREACAELCERMARRTEDIRSAALEMAAENIRARGNDAA